MIDISVRDVKKEYGDVEVLRGVSFDVQAGEHVGILGANGAGKTTLFRLICGQERPDGGSVTVFPGRRLGILSQIPEYPDGTSTGDVLRRAFAELDELQAELDELSSAMAQDHSLVRRYGEAAHRFEHAGGFETELRLGRVRNGLDISDDLYSREFSTLSGGEKTRINLARIILEEPDILLLDEPTNHLDMKSIEWLEDFLSRYKGTVLCISHDRYFLDGVINRVVEIEDGVSILYSGNYSAYAQEKQRRWQEQMDRYVQEQRKISQLEATARRMHDYAGKSAKLHRRAFAIEKRAERMKKTDRPKTAQTMKGHFKQVKFMADDAMRIYSLSKRFGAKEIAGELTMQVRPGERIALLGDNGTGKTTLMRMLIGEEPADSGYSRMGPAVKYAYLPQQIEWAHPERTLLDTMLYEEDCPVQEARDRLGMFHFRGEDVFKTVDVLSGGERNRLKLCMLMGGAVNMLLLDEPTNHLDIRSREWMEEAVEEFGGTMVFISHDRYFISRFATRVWELSGGDILDFHGDYEAFKAYKEALKAEEDRTRPPAARVEKETKPKRGKGSKEREKKAKALEARLSKLEQEEAGLDEQIIAHGDNAEKLLELLDQKESVRRQWQDVYEEWEALE